MGRIMAFDYGLKRTGIAVTDPMRIIATSLETVDTLVLMQFVEKYIAREQVDLFVVGMPVMTNGAPSEIVPHVKGFIKRLHDKFPEITVDTADERFTSKMASNAIAMSGMSKARRQDKALIDKVSATIILQSYIEHVKNKM